MASTVGDCRLVGPPKLYLAFALAIVKQNPIDRPVKDYILQIRGLIKGVKASHVVIDDKFFDSTRFWQSAFEESQAEQTKLLDKVFELEQRNQSFLARTHERPVTGVASPTSKKRKAGIEENLKRAETAKRRSRYRTRDIRPPTQEPTNLEPLSLMRPLYTLQRALQNKRTNVTLVNDAVTLCKAAERELLTAVLMKSGAEVGNNNGQAKEPGLNVIAKGVGLAFQLVYRGLHRVAAGKKDTELKGQITYYLVCLFESTMRTLTQHCAGMASYVLHNGDQSSTDDGAKAAQSLTDLLSTMALSLDLARPEDKEVMEGFLLVTLNRVGKLLALFTFSNWRPPSSLCPDMRPAGLAVIEDEGLSSHNAQIEARLLLTFLSNVLVCDGSVSSAKSHFIHSLKDRLHKSLLQAVFGEDDPFFKEGLTRPATPPPQTCEPLQADENESSEWFIQELWRLVGWDMLNSLVNRP